MYVQNANKSHIVHDIIVRHVSLNVIVYSVLDSFIRVLLAACFVIHIYIRISPIHVIFHGVEATHAYSRL